MPDVLFEHRNIRESLSVLREAIASSHQESGVPDVRLERRAGFVHLFIGDERQGAVQEARRNPQDVLASLVHLIDAQLYEGQC